MEVCLATENRRRIRIINQHQYQFIIWMLLLIIGVTLVFGFAIIFLINQAIASLPHPIPEDINLKHSLIFKSLPVIIIIALFLYIITFWLLIIITHKIYGPIFRLGKFMRSLSHGEKTGELAFRKGDAVDHLSDIYNELYASLQKTLHYDYHTLVRIFSEMEDLLDQVYNNKYENGEIFNSLQNICNRIAKALDITMTRIRH